MATRAPDGLGPKSKRLWRSITADFELSAAELRILEDACREIDLVERMEEHIAARDLVVAGSMGQDVAAPMVQEIRQHRATVQKLLAALKLPADEDGLTGSSASSSARALANKRWGRGA